MNRSYSKIRHIQETNQRLENRLFKQVITESYREVEDLENENEDTSMDEYINYDIKSVDCQDSSLDDDYWRGSMYVKEDEDGNPLVVIRYCKGDDEELNRLKRKARHYMEKSNQLPSDNESIFENKKDVRLTESDLVRIINRIINEEEGNEYPSNIEDFTKHHIKSLFKEIDINTINDATKKLQDMYGSSYKFEVEKNSPRNRRGIHLFKVNSDGEKEKLVYAWPIKIGKK